MISLRCLLGVVWFIFDCDFGEVFTMLYFWEFYPAWMTNLFWFYVCSLFMLSSAAIDVTYGIPIWLRLANYLGRSMFRSSTWKSISLMCKSSSQPITWSKIFSSRGWEMFIKQVFSIDSIIASRVLRLCLAEKAISSNYPWFSSALS